ncbi:MAG: hypothetical protein AB8B78_03305 [Polaribacter sp.]
MSKENKEIEYNLIAHCTISVTTKVKANSLEEAIKIADQRTDILNGQFEHPDENEHSVAEDYDGVPTNIRELKN